MAQASRIFPVETHPTGPWPLNIGLEGPPGGGKTLSALRLAKGIASVRGGVPIVIDTEAGRSAAYRAQIEFGLVRLDPPYRSTRFLECIEELIRIDKPACIIVDSLSDEHEGAGGVLEWHEEEVDRRLGKDKDNWQRREALSMAGWIVPKAARTRLVSGILRITTPVIFTFRAREKTRPVRDPQSGKTVPTKLGYQAIAPAEICHAMTCMCLLPPHAEGRPIWRSEEAGQDFLLKRPNFLADILTEAQLDEATGAKLATWAQGNKTAAPGLTQTEFDAMNRPMTWAKDAAKAADLPAAGEAVRTVSASPERVHPDDVHGLLSAAADKGVEALQKAWKGLKKSQTTHVTPERLEMLKAIAREADERRASRAVDEPRGATLTETFE